jgi:hypothetical protein
MERKEINEENTIKNETFHGFIVDLRASKI